MKYLNIILSIIILSVFASCGSHKRTTSQKIIDQRQPNKVVKKTVTPVKLQKIDEADVIHADLI